jgi:hypothetical protein
MKRSEFSNRVETLVGEWKRLTLALNEGAAVGAAASDRLIEKRADRFNATDAELGNRGFHTAKGMATRDTHLPSGKLNARRIPATASATVSE